MDESQLQSGLLILTVGCLMTAFGLLRYWKSATIDRESVHWPQVEGSIVKSNVSVDQEDGTSIVSIAYQYRVDGQQHEGNFVKLFVSGDRAGFGMVERFPVGRRVMIRHSPERAAESLFELSPRRTPLPVFSPLIALLGGVMVLEECKHVSNACRITYQAFGWLMNQVF